MYADIVTKKFNALKGKKDTVILGIESSCDETCAAVLKGGREVLSNVVSSQIAIHARFGGVVPEVASRNHTLSINEVVAEALANAGLALNDIDAVAVTYGAGLLGALLVGVSAAKAISYAKNIPLIKVSHIEAHIAAGFITHNSLTPPFLAVVASGGHTSLLSVQGYNDFVSLGGTSDDAIGEAFDKVARLLGLPYPGGPSIERVAEGGRADIEFMKAKNIAPKNIALSFSGLKTAVLNYVNTLKQKGEKIPVSDIAASFSATAINLLVNAAVAEAGKRSSERIVLAGGVAANRLLRETLLRKAAERGIEVLYPDISLCTDNAAMVAARGFCSAFEGKNLSDLNLNASSVIQR